MKVSIGKYPKNGSNQKISVKIDPWDTWSMDHTLALIVYPMLKQLKKTQHGAPCTDDEDVPEKLRSTNSKSKKNEWDTDSNHFKRWNWIMDEMIWVFGELVKGKEPNFWIKKPKYKTVKDENKHWAEIVNPGKHDDVKAKAYYDRQKNAFRLFGKYYQNLWD
ncbi:hypothetical protein EBT25_18790 [bacterium]|jgi:hypothetical protein|nr:hypothetical protein [bacterium]